MAKKKQQTESATGPIEPFVSAYNGFLSDVQGGHEGAFTRYVDSVKSAWAKTDARSMDAASVATVASQLMTVCMWANGQQAAAAGVPASPFMAAPASPFMAAPASPFMAAPASPFMAAPASPFMAAPASPFMAAPASPFMASPGGEND